CLRLLIQTVFCALLFALDKAGRRRLARMATMAITTRSSIKVKPARVRDGHNADQAALAPLDILALILKGIVGPCRTELVVQANCLAAWRCHRRSSRSSLSTATSRSDRPRSRCHRSGAVQTRRVRRP